MDRHKTSSLVRIDQQTYDELLEISEQTRLGIGKIATAAIEYALDHAKLVPSNVKDIVFVDEKRPRRRRHYVEDQ